MRKTSLACYDKGSGDLANVTAAMRAGLHEPVLEPGEVREHEFHLRGGKAKRGKRIRGSLRFHAENYYDGWGSDVVTARVNLR